MMNSQNPFQMQNQQTMGYPMAMNTFTIPMIYGKTIASENEILPSQIPNNGSLAYFPLADGKKIIARYLQPNGQFATVTYSLDQVPSAQEAPQQVQEQKNDPVNQELISVLSKLSSALEGFGQRLENVEKTLNE